MFTFCNQWITAGSPYTSSQMTIKSLKIATSSNTPDSAHRFVSRDCKTWTECVRWRNHPECAVGCLRTGLSESAENVPKIATDTEAQSRYWFQLHHVTVMSILFKSSESIPNKTIDVHYSELTCKKEKMGWCCLASSGYAIPVCVAVFVFAGKVSECSEVPVTSFLSCPQYLRETAGSRWRLQAVKLNHISWDSRNRDWVRERHGLRL